VKRRVAVLADDMLQRHLLQQALNSQGHEVVLNADPARMQQMVLQDCQPDVWLVNLNGSQADSDELLDYLFSLPAPVLIGEGRAPEHSSDDFTYWQRSLSDKITSVSSKSSAVVADDSFHPESLPADCSKIRRLLLPEALETATAVDGQPRPARKIWLLAGSLGGPDAVKEFLDVLPAGLPIGFLYAQHIDPAFEHSLPRVVGRHSQWRVRNPDSSDQVYEGDVVVVPIERVLEFCTAGKIVLRERQWSGLYSPSIDQVMRNLAATYAQSCGVIIFSGMDEDGSQACEYVVQQGAPVWTQSEESCACPSMPESARKTGFSSYSSSPRGLAMALINHLLRAQKLNSTGDE